MRTRAPLAAAALFAAAWTDERALLAAPLLLVYALQRRERVRGIAIVAAGAAYAVTRIYFSDAYHLHTTADGTGFAVFLHHFNMVPLGIWTGLAGCWLIVAAGLWSLVVQRRFLAQSRPWLRCCRSWQLRSVSKMSRRACPTHFPRSFSASTLSPNPSRRRSSNGLRR